MAQVNVTMDQFLRLSKRLDQLAQRLNEEVNMFPVGALYLSEDNPAACLGGQWERYASGSLLGDDAVLCVWVRVA